MALCFFKILSVHEFLRLANVLTPVIWIILIMTFLLRFFLTILHVLGNWAFSYPVHSKIQVSDWDVLDEPFHG
jgi:hypothetical protein